jgi:hypothetical protein
MKVKELIELLQTFDPELPVAYEIYSEQCLLEPNQLKVKECALARPDGWVQHARNDMLRTPYLIFPGT